MVILRIKEFILALALRLQRTQDTFCSLKTEDLQEGRTEFHNPEEGISYIEKEYSNMTNLILFYIGNAVKIQIAVAKVPANIPLKDICEVQSKLFSTLTMDYAEGDEECILFLQRELSWFDIFNINKTIANINKEYFAVEDFISLDNVAFLEKLFNNN